jgi:hypothetical protein
MIAGRLIRCLALALALAGCVRRQPASRAEPEAGDDGAIAAAATDAAAPSGSAAGVWLAPLLVATPVMSALAMPGRHGRGTTDDGQKGVRLGYLRIGEKVLANPDPRRTENCPEGWYEIVGGGFVCGKHATTDLKSPKVRMAPHPPFTEGPLPYEYGTNHGQGTPLYRAVPTREERTQLEPWLVAKPKAEADTETASAARPEPAAADPDGGAPWYMRDYDGGRPPVTLGDLKERGPIARRMMKGFYISLDKKFTSDGVTWWRAASGLIAPVNRVSVYRPRTEFHGVWLGAAPADPDGGRLDAGADALPPGTNDAKTPWIPLHPIAKMPVGIVTSARAGRYAVREDKQQVSQPGVAARFTIAGLTGKKAVVRTHTYWETDSDWWMGDNEAVIPEPGPPPEGLGPDEKWIDVNLTHQFLIAFEGQKPVFVTLVSSGKKNETDKEKDHRTVTGSFRIREKYISATMDDDSASDGPYSIEDVPWIMYFRRGYALHGAFWHDDFGHRRSHGCINLAPWDAKALFQWTDPPLPTGWHAAFATEEHPGTRVVVHD